MAGKRGGGARQKIPSYELGVLFPASLILPLFTIKDGRTESIKASQEEAVDTCRNDNYSHGGLKH